jgi:hypothetical protein
MKFKSIKIEKICLMIKIKFLQENCCIISGRSILLWEKDRIRVAQKHTDPTDLDADSEHWVLYTSHKLLLNEK